MTRPARWILFAVSGLVLLVLLAAGLTPGGLELRVVGIDKGRAVDQILAGSPPEAAAAYLGDDLTDEDAFAALSGRGERVLTVLVREEWRPTRAEVWLRPPGGLLAFLGRWSRISGSPEWIS